MHNRNDTYVLRKFRLLHMHSNHTFTISCRWSTTFVNTDISDERIKMKSVEGNTQNTVSDNYFGFFRAHIHPK